MVARMSRKSLQICIYLAVAAWESLEPLLSCLQRLGRLAFPLPVCKQHLWFANRISLCQPSHPVPRSFLVVCPERCGVFIPVRSLAPCSHELHLSRSVGNRPASTGTGGRPVRTVSSKFQLLQNASPFGRSHGPVVSARVTNG